RSVHGDASDVVVGIGGGSALDTAKAVAAMAPLWAVGPRSDTVSVRRYLEGVGDLAPPPHRLPLIAIPTTAGTGSEATKNAVIAEIGPDGFKKSLRHDAYVPDHVIIDPTLAIGLPRQISSASALDALTQLLEAYTSINANPYIDALALDAIGRVGNALRAFLEKGEDSVPLRSELAYGAYISGIALANAGLGYVHAIAGPLGALHHAPHGVICANLIEPVNRAMMEVARDTVFLEKMERVSRLWGEGVVDRLGRLVRLAGLPRLGTFGYTAAELAAIGEKATGRTSPVTLKSEDIVRILHGLY
ncbi:MAG: iron-containing alcohol dehydrogenase, partial [Sphaerochaetaceae bacterium]|nr:iron-containing alcohol dehydrogenase [Sphaerochaetaceae bacterium]